MKPIITLLFFMTTLQAIAQKQAPCSFQWKVAAELQPENGMPSIGYAGMIAGISNDVLIAGGGANFPDAMPWQGGKKFYNDKIFVLTRNKHQYNWQQQSYTLPEPVAYAGSATTGNGVVYAGGENANGISGKVFLLQWNENKKTVVAKPLPSLPVAVTAPAVAAVGNTVYVACGDEAQQSSNQFFCIDIDGKAAKWKKLPDAPKAFANAALVAQAGKLFLIGGRTKSPNGISTLHSSVYAFDLKKNSWQPVADIFDGENTTPFTAAAAFAVGSQYIVLAGGDKGEIFHKIETAILNITLAASPASKENMTKEKNRLVMHHAGFSTDVLLYDVQKNTWQKIGAMPYAAQVTTAAVKWKNDLLIVSGEIRPGVRSAKVLEGSKK